MQSNTFRPHTFRTTVISVPVISVQKYIIIFYFLASKNVKIVFFLKPRKRKIFCTIHEDASIKFLNSVSHINQLLIRRFLKIFSIYFMRRSIEVGGVGVQTPCKIKIYLNYIIKKVPIIFGNKNKFGFLNNLLHLSFNFYLFIVKFYKNQL